MPYVGIGTGGLTFGTGNPYGSGYDPSQYGTRPPQPYLGDTMVPSPTGAPMDTGGGGGPLAAIGKFLTQNPALVTGLAGAAANVYGAYKAGKAQDKQIQVEQQHLQEQDALAKKAERDRQIEAIISAMASYR